MSPEAGSAAGGPAHAAGRREPEEGGRCPDAVHHGPVAVFGGVYSNHLALRAVIRDARKRGAEALYCLGDLGAFGPNPDKVPPLLLDAGVTVMRGNYDDSLARGLDDCQCGYTDPRDNHFARLSYRYTFRNTSQRWKDWMGTLPEELRVRLGDTRVLMCHGSPRRMNEFLWESTTSTDFLAHLARAHGANAVLATHTGIPWTRALPGGGLFVNVGCIGRPANDGRTEVWYALLRPGGEGGSAAGDVAPGPAAAAPRRDGVSRSEPRASAEASGGSAARPGAAAPDAGDGVDEEAEPLRAEFVPVAYDHEALAEEMRAEELPEEFVETVLTGWWTTCLEVLPAAERRRGKF